MLGEVSRLRSVLGPTEKKVAGLQKELDRMQSSVSDDWAKQLSLETHAQELEAENVRLQVEIEKLKDDHAA